jgi:signal transduction histidine kinase
VGILDLDISSQPDSQKFIYPTAGNRPMLNSDRDLDLKSNYPVARSQWQSIAAGAVQPDPQIVTELSIEQLQFISIFAEATARAVRLEIVPVAIVTAIAPSGYQIGAIAGLDRFTRLPTQPNLRLELAGLEYCHDRVIGGESSLNIPNCQQYPHLAQSALIQLHGVRSYLGVPIITAARDRLGTLSILDFKPRQFSDRDIELLQTIGQLIASEFERKLLSQAQLNHWIGDLRYRELIGFDDAIAAAEHQHSSTQPSVEIARSNIWVDARSANSGSNQSATDLVRSPLPDCQSDLPQIPGEIQFKLLTHLAQELRTPLTSILGMASVLQQEIYGSLSSKQKDYLGIIYQSGQQLVTIVDEIAQLGDVDRQQSQLALKSVDLEMLCQLAIQPLASPAQKKNQQIILDLAGGSAPLATLGERIWLLDKDKVRQIIYYLCSSLIHAGAIDSQISIWLSHLTDGLQIQIFTNDLQVVLCNLAVPIDLQPQAIPDSILAGITNPDRINGATQIGSDDLRISLGLCLCQTLTTLHRGQIELMTDRQGYQLTLPLIIADPG